MNMKEEEDDAAANANRVSSPSYWLDACEDISCDFIDFDSSSSSSTTTLDNNNSTTTTTVDDVLLPTPNNQDFFGGIDRIFDSIKNGDGLPQPNALAVQEQQQEQDNRCNKRARLAGCYNSNNHQPTNDRFERSFNNNRKRPRDGGVTDTRKKKRPAGGNHHHHHHHQDFNKKGYWVRDNLLRSCNFILDGISTFLRHISPSALKHISLS
jgi:hypothetical protein